MEEPNKEELLEQLRKLKEEKHMLMAKVAELDKKIAEQTKEKDGEKYYE